ncbi:MAG: hypothetical protein Q7S22_08220 [Candidatus Micrarchaeota archaeon]|nr:hypothetical protein [Candidatus Micrarchaeota archaeon]
MTEKRITINAKCRVKLDKLMPLFSSLGYNKVEYKKDKIIIEKFTQDLQGENTLDYGILLKTNSLEFYYSQTEGSGKRKRMVELFQTFMDVLTIIGKNYLVEPTEIAKNANSVLKEVAPNLDKDLLEVNAQLEESKEKHDDLKKRYEDLVRSSEENARILLECERRRDELRLRVEELGKLSDESLIQEVYQWIKIHGGSIDTTEFCKAYGIPPKRAEEGLEILIKTGFIRRRSD